MKPGWKTSEFWLSLAAVIVPVVLPGVQISPDVWMALSSGVAGIYTAVRGYTKGKK